MKGFQAQSFVGVMAPAKTPAEIVAQAAGGDRGRARGGQRVRPGSSPATGSELASPEQMTPAGFAAFIKRDYEDMRAAATAAGINKK